ncbi:hypothetical protein Fot_24649 [Forsythia ovata]|uniref:Uncharacterized protein n=1 Tax=Forsythia ovata TaxID=205694 RepID=A0ABD1U6S6_9LAMI
MRLLRICSWNSCLTTESRDIVEVLDDPHLCIRCTFHASLDESEQEYVRLFISDLRKEEPILNAHLHVDKKNRTVRDEEPVDVLEDVRDDDPVRSPVTQDAHARCAEPHAPPHRSYPCCEHQNLLRKILQQMERLVDKFNELNRKVDRSKEWR